MNTTNNSVEPIRQDKTWFVRNVNDLTPIFGSGPFELNAKTAMSHAVVEHVGVVFFSRGKYVFKRCKSSESKHIGDEHVYVVTKSGMIAEKSGGERMFEEGDVLFGKASRLMKARQRAHIMRDTWQDGVAERMVNSIFGRKQ